MRVAVTRPDVDLPILTTEPGRYLEVEAWVRALGGGRIVETQAWGPLTERRSVLPSGLEVEAGIALVGLDRSRRPRYAWGRAGRLPRRLRP